MEQLMEELDRRSARMLTDQAIVEHVIGAQRAEGEATAGGAARSSERTSRPEAGTATQPVRVGRDHFFAARLAGAWREDLTSSERRALLRIARNPSEDNRAFYYTRKDNVMAYRYTRAVYAGSECLGCHADRKDAVLSIKDDKEALKLPRGLMGTVTVDVVSQRETNQLLLNRVFFLAAGLLAGALAIIVFSVITYRFILQPVRVLQETAEKVAEGDLDIRSHIGSGDEFQQLSETLNTMLANLQRSEEQLRSANTSLGTQLAEMSETNVALAETNRLKSEFLANVTHELKTPLNSILGFAELLRKSFETAQDPKGLRYANNIYASGSNLLALITDLLDLAKVEAGRMEVRPSEFPLGELVETLLGALKPLTEPKEMKVVTEIDAEVPILVQDVTKIRQILFNLLSNAIKFSPDKGTIQLRATMESPSAVRISVQDEGPGIEPGMQRMIFEKFRQAEGGKTRTHGGTGLGLAISRELTALLGGRIGVESNPGEGSTFFVVLPVRIEAAEAAVREG
jgi:signal transduction histidine kinase